MTEYEEKITKTKLKEFQEHVNYDYLRSLERKETGRFSLHAP